MKEMECGAWWSWQEKEATLLRYVGNKMQGEKE